MKKMILTLIMPFALLTTGCSAVNDVANGLEYVPAATNYIKDVQQFSSDIPTIAEQAITDENARVQLEESLIEMKTDIQEFNELKPPTVFEDIHVQVIEQNAVLEEGIDTYLKSVKDGQLNPDLLSNTGLLEEISVYKDLMDQIKQLNQ